MSEWVSKYASKQLNEQLPVKMVIEKTMQPAMIPISWGRLIPYLNVKISDSVRGASACIAYLYIYLVLSELLLVED